MDKTEILKEEKVVEKEKVPTKKNDTALMDIIVCYLDNV